MFSRQLTQTELLHMLPITDGCMEEFLQSVKKKCERNPKPQVRPLRGKANSRSSSPSDGEHGPTEGTAQSETRAEGQSFARAEGQSETTENKNFFMAYR